jgi:hypothetical protein
LYGFEPGQIPVKLIPGMDQILFHFQKTYDLPLQVITLHRKFVVVGWTFIHFVCHLLMACLPLSI